MYVGRIVGVGRTPLGEMVAAYRVSSRSFPNRSARQMPTSVRIVPDDGSADARADSPYISYECLLWNDRYAVVSNGTHTRPVYEQLAAGRSPRDAIVGVLAGLDREFDVHDTPRICGLIDLKDRAFWLGSITADSLCVRPLTIAPGELAFVSTYE